MTHLNHSITLPAPQNHQLIYMSSLTCSLRPMKVTRPVGSKWSKRSDDFDHVTLVGQTWWVTLGSRGAYKSSHPRFQPQRVNPPSSRTTSRATHQGKYSQQNLYLEIYYYHYFTLQHYINIIFRSLKSFKLFFDNKNLLLLFIYKVPRHIFWWRRKTFPLN